MAPFPPGQTLLIDADDTLWENNIYFERAIAAFISYLDHKAFTPAQVRQALNAVERETILTHGYGLTSFRRSLVDCYQRLTGEEVTEDHRNRIRGFADVIENHEIEFLPGVPETLAYLAGRHKLILMTKGNHAEQADKFARSGLQPHFATVEIVREKDPAAYLDVVARRRLDAAGTFMIGNSPKSDINPALAAGLNAVHLFHKDTWVLEHAELAQPQPGRQLLEIEAFCRLAELF